MIRALLFLAIVTVAVSLRAVSLDRRGAIIAAVGAAATPWLNPGSAHALEGKDLQGVIARAKGGSLATEAVIGRALRNDMIDPKQLPDCPTLEKVFKIDQDAAQEMKLANGKFQKLLNAAKKNVDSGDEKEVAVVSTLEKAIQVSRMAEGRIEQRIGVLGDKYNTECMVID
jgi:hypothetical protein